MRNIYRGSRVALCLALALVCGPAAAQKSGVVQEKATVTVIEVPVNVLGKDGKPLAGLTAADFELYDNGKKQEITGFEVVNLRPTTPEAVNPFAEPPLAAARRHWFLVFDLSYASPSADPRTGGSALFRGEGDGAERPRRRRDHLDRERLEAGRELHERPRAASPCHRDSRAGQDRRAHCRSPLFRIRAAQRGAGHRPSIGKGGGHQGVLRRPRADAAERQRPARARADRDAHGLARPDRAGLGLCARPQVRPSLLRRLRKPDADGQRRPHRESSGPDRLDAGHGLRVLDRRTDLEDRQ